MMDSTPNFTNESPSVTRTTHGPDFILQENIAEAVRKKTPERLTNIKGSGAYGKFTVTQDISQYSKAQLFSEVGNHCRIFARFSGMHSERGGSDHEREVRGFALKFYTQEGNWDLVGSNTPVFYIKDAPKFPQFLQSHTRNPQTNLKSANAMWDFYSQHPESLHQLLMLMSGRGKPASYRQMHGYGGHTYSLINEHQDKVWVKFHFKTKQGIENFENSGAHRPDFAQKDLVEAIKSSNYPKWTMYIQIMTDEQAKEYRWNPFDVTKVWFHDDFPLIEVGELELNEIPEDYFEHVEQAAFSPANIIPGIGFSPDKLLQTRLFSYADAQRHRLGNNLKNLQVNQSISTNSNKQFEDELLSSGFINPNPYDNEDDHYTQPGLFYTKALTGNDRTQLVRNILESMKQISGPNKPLIINRQLCHFFRANIELGMKIAMGLQVNIDANMMNHTLSS